MAAGKRLLFGQKLQEYRKQKGLTASRLAELSGYNPATISRLERGILKPSNENAERLSEALSLTKAEARALFEIVDIFSVEFAPWGAPWDASTAKFQQIVKKREKDATLIQNFEWIYMSGLVQTREYMEALFACVGDTSSALAEAVAVRLKRQAVLKDQRKQIQIVLAENVLRTRFTSEEDHQKQLDHLIEFTALPNVDIRILPSAVTLTFSAPNGFWLYDSSLATVETYTAEVCVWDSPSIERYKSLFGLIRAASASGRASHHLIRRVRKEMGE